MIQLQNIVNVVSGTPAFWARRLIICILSAGISADAGAYCLENSWPAGSPITVKLYDIDGLFVGLDADAAGRAVARALDNWNENGLAEVRMTYGGVTTSAGTWGDGIVLVRETSDCNKCIPGMTGSPACNDPNDTGGDRSDCNIWIEYNQNSCPQHNWGFYPNSTTGIDDFQAVVTHELGHCIGITHPSYCSDSGKGVMGGGGSQFSDQRYVSRDDVQGLIAHYGRLSAVINYKESLSGLSWSSGSPVISNSTYGPISSVTSASLGETTVWLAFLDMSGSAERVKFRWGNNTGFTTPAVVDSGNWSYDAPAVAKGIGTAFVTFTALEGASNNNKYVRYRFTTDGGSTWTSGYVADSGGSIRTRRDGLSAGYDPITDRFIIAYLGDDNNASSFNCNTGSSMCDEIRIFTIMRDGTSPNHSTTGIQSIDAPGIACADSGTENCVLAWVDITGSACLHWGHGYVESDGDYVNYNDLSTECYIGYQTPYVAFQDTGTSYPYKLVLRQATNSVYAFRKLSSLTAEWSDENSFVVSPWVYSPSIGTFDYYTPQYTAELDLFYVVP